MTARTTASSRDQGPGPSLTPDQRTALGAVLERAREIGLLGPGPVDEHIDHALGYWLPLTDGWAGAPPAGPMSVADLGAGAGLPSLPLLCAHRELHAVLVEASQKRASFLVWAVVTLGLGERAEVWRGRAEELAHRSDRRERFDAVVARGFGPPAWTLECGAPLLRLGGRLVVSEPPAYRSYPVEGVARCGLSLVAQHHGMAVFVRDQPVDQSQPRPAKTQSRRPRFVL